jgi:hypothetical protein
VVGSPVADWGDVVDIGGGLAADHARSVVTGEDLLAQARQDHVDPFRGRHDVQ